MTNIGGSIRMPDMMVNKWSVFCDLLDIAFGMRSFKEK